MMEAQVFNNNAIYVYFLSCIVIFSYQHFTKRQKVSLIYATTIAMELISQYSWKLTAVMLFLSMFILEEYLSDDKVKCDLLSNLWYKVLDFVYQFVFINAGACISVNVGIADYQIRDLWIRKEFPLVLFYGINIFVLLVTIHLLNTSKFGLYDFGVMKSYFDKFNGRKIEWESEELQRRFDVMTALEDKSYFERATSYNWISIQFIKYKINAYRAEKEWRRRYKEKKTLRHFLKCTWALIRRFRLFRYIFRKIWTGVSETVMSIYDFAVRLRRKIRGCATLEMQLIRNIGIEKGYTQCVVRRKFFELFYTYLFFNGLKAYYKNTQNNKQKEFKKFILYVYLHSIKLNIFGNDFKSINLLFPETKVEEWDMDAFYIAILSLTGAPVTPRRMVLYPELICTRRIDLNRALVWLNMIRRRDITETEKKPFAKEEVKQVFYVVQDCIVPCVHMGKFYGPSEEGDNWPPYEENRYMDFSRMVYEKIWGTTYTGKTGTEDDMMGNYHSLEERKISAEHCRMYLGQAEAGAVIRLSDKIKGNDHRIGNGYSHILLTHDEDGVTLYESDSRNTRIAYFTWEEYSDRYGKYKYFKYIKWPVYV